MERVNDKLIEAAWRAMGWTREELGEQWWVSPLGYRSCQLPTLTLDLMLEWAADQGWFPGVWPDRHGEAKWKSSLHPWADVSAPTRGMGSTPGEALARALVAAAGEGGGENDNV